MIRHQAERLHASAVALGREAVVVLGRAGSGKSCLCLELMAFGATLVGDDQVILDAEGARLLVRPAENLAGLIEARGIGILTADHLDEAEVKLFVDLDKTASERCPPPQSRSYLGLTRPCVHMSQISSFPAAILQYLRSGRAEV